MKITYAMLIVRQLDAYIATLKQAPADRRRELARYIWLSIPGAWNRVLSCTSIMSLRKSIDVYYFRTAHFLLSLVS